MNPRRTHLATVFRRREKREVPPEMARLRARAPHLRGEIFYLRPAYTQRLRWELAGLERRTQEMVRCPGGPEVSGPSARLIGRAANRDERGQAHDGDQAAVPHDRRPFGPVCRE